MSPLADAGGDAHDAEQDPADFLGAEADDVSVEAEALFSAGNWHVQMGSFDKAVLSFRMAATRAKTLGDTQGQLAAYQSAADALLAAGALKEAVQVTDEVVAFWVDAGSPPWQLAMTLTTLARLHLQLFDEASAADDPNQEGAPMHGELALQAAENAWACFEDVMKDVDEATATKAKEDLAATIHTYTDICLAMADWESALPAAREAKRLFQEVCDEWAEAGATLLMSRAYFGLGHLDAAREAAEWARAQCKLSGNELGTQSAQSILEAIREQGGAQEEGGDDEQQADPPATGSILDYSRFETIGSSSDEEEAPVVLREASGGAKEGLPPPPPPPAPAPPTPAPGGDPASLAAVKVEEGRARESYAPSYTDTDTATESDSPFGVRVRYLYASPLVSGEHARPLDIRADLQAMEAANGIHTKVRVATAESLREALFARPCPGILHITAHCLLLGGAISLALEDACSAVHMMSAADLAAAGPWDGVDLLVFLSCASEALTRKLINMCNLQRAVCCSQQVLDRAAHLFCATFYQALGVGRALLSCHEIARAAVRNSSDAMISSMADKFVLLGEPAPQACGLWTPVPVALPQEPWPSWPLWPRVEDFVGRQSATVNIVRLFDQRRAMCLWGPRGLGKTAFCTELCHHYSAPGGRRFSAGAFMFDYTSTVRGVNGDQPDAFACAMLDALREQGHHAMASNVSSTGTVRQTLRNAARQLDQKGSWLLVIDGIPRSSRLRSQSPSSSCFSSGPSSDEEGGYRVPCTPLDSLHEILGELLSNSARLCVLLTARFPLRGQWAALGLSKVVEIELPPLAPDDTARLLARRAARPFYRRDFGNEGTGGGSWDGSEPLMLDQELLGLLARSPLSAQLGGNPGRVVAAASEVHAGLPSLLLHPWLLPSVRPV